MKVVQPHEAFRLDFDQIAEEGRIQEELHPNNRGEYAISKGLHTFFENEVLPLISENDWVYEAAHTFVTTFRPKYFVSLKLTGGLAHGQQSQFAEVRERVTDFVARAHLAGFVPELKNLTKLSDFTSIVNVEQLPSALYRKAMILQQEAQEVEGLQLEAALRTLRDNYERAFPRVFFVVRRALKVNWKRKSSPTDMKLLQPSDYIQWYMDNARQSHPLHHLLIEHRNFYKVARNVASHHQGLEWKAENNLVVLEDENDQISIHVDRFFQQCRYMTYFCELGVRGILTAFAEREQGSITNKLIVDFSKTFPDGWESGERGKVVLYKE